MDIYSLCGKTRLEFRAKISMYYLLFLTHIDQSVALWFHEHLTHASSGVLILMSDPGSPEYVGSITALTGFFLMWKRLWHHLLALGMAIPGGMLLNILMKTATHRARPFPSSPYIDVGGYSFPSGHTMAATLLYGVLAIFVISMLKGRHSRFLTTVTAAILVVVVAFSRVALGAHYVTDVLAAMITGIIWLYFSLGAVRKIMPKPAGVVVAAEENQ